MIADTTGHKALAADPPQNAAIPPPIAGVPDAKWINEYLPIDDVARKLGCEVYSTAIRCWHPERHQNGDRTPSVGINRKTNRVKCFGCAGGSKYLSVVDLVADFLGVKPGPAIRWIDQRFKVPRIAKGARLSNPARERSPVGLETPLQLIVWSGVFAKLTSSAQRLLPVILAFAEPDAQRRYAITISYNSIKRNSGIQSRNAIKEALDCLEGWSLLERVPVARPELVAGESAGLPPVASYLFMPYSDAFQELAHTVSVEHKAAIEVERGLRETEHADRKKFLKKAWARRMLTT